MANLKTTYLGLELKNPLIVGSSGLTSSAESILKLAEIGAAAVVLKSIFEEEIQMEFKDVLKNQLGSMEDNLEYLDYFDYHLKDERLKKTADIISEVKSKSDIKIIASINCRSVGEWFSYAAKLQTAGADAIELNIFRNSVSPNENAATISEQYLNIIRKVKEYVTIPVSVKMSPYFTDLPYITSQMEQIGVEGFVFFNRFYNPDFDLKSMKFSPTQVYSNPTDYLWALRWVSILSKQLNTNISASTGVHSTDSFIKMLVAGASTVQVVSALYKNGPTYIQDFLAALNDWMDKNSLNNMDEVKSFAKDLFPANSELFERVQFMKYFGGFSE